MEESREIREIKELHSKIFVGNLLIKMYYPNVISFLVNKVGLEEAQKRIFQIGKNMVQEMLKIWDPKTKAIKSIIQKLWKKMWNTSKYMKIKKVKERNRTLYIIRDKRCGVCDPETSLEGINIPCVSVAGYIDACLDHIASITPLPTYKVETVKSIVMGDPYCEHQIELMGAE